MPDYMFLLESRISPEQREVLGRVQAAAREHELNIYLTGGAVRDLISGMPIRDLDFTVEGNPARIARDLEKHGARVLEENDRLRHFELEAAGGVDLSVAAARDEIYPRPGAKPDLRWATIMEDLRRRDFTVNAIAISLNPASRGLLLDPTNGLADLENREMRVLSMHSFTNRPIRLLRILRYCARLDFKLESRTAEWFALAMERGLHESLEGDAVGEELRQLAREEKCSAVLKAWEARGLIAVIHPRLARRHPDYDRLARLMRVRESMVAARIFPRLFAPVTWCLLARLSPRERSSALSRARLRSAEMEAVHGLEAAALKVVKMLKGRKTASAREAYYFLEKVAADLQAFILTEFSQAKVLAKIRSYVQKWRPMRLALPALELETLGVPRGPQFDKILQDFFHLQLAGKGRNPQDRIRLLRQLAGIKPEPKKKEKEKEKEARKKEAKAAKGATPAPAAAAAPPKIAKGAAPAAPAGKLQQPAPAAPPVKKGTPAAKAAPAAKPPEKASPPKGKSSSAGAATQRKKR